MTQEEKDLDFVKNTGLKTIDEKLMARHLRIAPRVLNNLMFDAPVNPPQTMPVPLRVRATLSFMTGRPMEQILPTTKIDSLPPLENLASTMTAVVRIYRKNAKALETSNLSSADVVQDIIDVVEARIASDKKP